MPEARSALRIIVIDERYCNLGFGSQFLRLYERWLSHKGINYRFNLRQLPVDHGYIQMPFNDPDDYETDSKDVEIGKILST